MLPEHDRVPMGGAEGERWHLVDVECAIRKRQAPPGGDQRAVAAALGKHAQSVRNWTRQGMPVESVSAGSAATM